MSETYPCPNCSSECGIMKVKKGTANHGRPFISCQECETFSCLDLGFCSKCNNPIKEMTVKKEGRNHGRRFRCCPNDCDGSFQWADCATTRINKKD